MTTENHDLNVPEEGTTDWHVPLNRNFEKLDEILKNISSDGETFTPTTLMTDELDVASGDTSVEGGATAGVDPNVRVAANFSGQNGGEQIQNAIDDLPDSGGVVVVGPEGPDDVSSSTGATNDGNRAQNAWEFSGSVTLPSHTIINFVGNPYCFLTDNAGGDGNLFKNENSTNGTMENAIQEPNRNEHIYLLGPGELDGNQANQSDNRSQSNASKHTQSCIFFDFGNDYVVHNLDIHDAFFHGVTIRGARSTTPYAVRNWSVTNNRIHECGSKNIGSGLGDTAHVEGAWGVFANNDCHDMTDTGCAIDKGLGIKVVNNSFHMTDPASNEYTAGQATTCAFGSYGCLYANNTVSDFRGRGFRIGWGQGDPSQYNAIIGNTIIYAERNNISIANSHDTIVADNMLCAKQHPDASDGLASSGRGIMVEDTATNVAIRDNYIAEFTTQPGITIQNTDGIELSDNILRANGTDYDIQAMGAVLDGVEYLPNIADGAVKYLNGGVPINDIVTVRDTTNDHAASFFLANGSITELADPSSNFGTTSASGNLHDVMWDEVKEAHQIENASGASASYEVSLGSLR